jgi:glycosyltransferase involved in cell wall biosynthesis
LTKILYLIDSLGIGGAERQLSLLLKYIAPHWETRVVSLGGGPYHQVLINQNTSVIVFPRRSRFDLLPVFQLYTEILHYKPDIIHSWGGLSSTLAAPICKILHIILIDGSIRIAGSTRYYWRRRITFSLSDHIIANSYAGLSGFQVNGAKSSVIYNAIDPQRLTILQKKSSNHNEVTKVVMTGRISPFKDFSSFFKAARCINTQQPGCWKFIAVGGGDEKDRKRFTRLAKDLVSSGVVELPQAGLEVIPYLKEADIGVLLSAACFKEGISNSIMEYMACGLPVICSDSGGNRELVIDGETGFIIPPENVHAFIEKLLYLKSHPDIAARMGKAGYQRIVSLFSIERMISEYESLYRMLLDRKMQQTPKPHMG